MVATRYAPPSCSADVDDDDYVDVPLVDNQGRNVAGVREVVIAVMGITGAGKSTLIKQLSNQEVEVGDGLEACTQRVTAIRMKYKGVNLTLLDSPGFNDTYRKDTDVLLDISAFLSDTYSNGFRLSGIIYLHPISHARMDGSSLLSLRMFRKLVGHDALSNVVLASTHWTRVTPAEGDRREKDLRDKFWRPLVADGAAMTRHTGDMASAVALLDRLVDKSCVVLDIQRELVDEGKALIDTAAGIALNEELIALQKRHEEELQRVRIEMENAVRESDERAQSELAEIRQQLQGQIAAARRSQSSLRERERLAARDKQQLQTQMQMIQMAFAKQKEELERKSTEREKALDKERKEWKGMVDAANRAAADQHSAQVWPHIADLANTAVNGFLMYLSMR